MTARTFVAAILVAALGTALAQPPAPTEPGPVAPVPIALQKVNPKGEKRDLSKLLATRVTIEKYGGKFKDAVQMLAEKFDLPLMLTRRAEEWRPNDDEGEPKAGEQVVKLPRLVNVKLGAALNILCEQAQTKFLIDSDHIRIVPDVFAWYETGVVPRNNDLNGDGVGCDPPLLNQANLMRNQPLTRRALVNASFKNKPFTEVIDDIAESTGANVALSPLLPANLRQAPVTVRFANTPVDAAVRILCEMTESGVIEDANVLLVTTRERVATRAQEQAQKVKNRQPPQPQQVIRVVPSFVPPLQPDLTDEITKLKEQNNQLKKDLDEIKKLLQK